MDKKDLTVELSYADMQRLIDLVALTGTDLHSLLVRGVDLLLADYGFAPTGNKS